MGIRVKAIDRGHYGHLQEPGDVFEIKHEKHFSKKWMELVDEKGASPVVVRENKEAKEKRAGKASAAAKNPKKAPKGVPPVENKDQERLAEQVDQNVI